MCHESSGAALNEAIGIGKGCVTLQDFEKCDCIFILGQNPGTNHPRMLTSLEHAKENGAKIVSINPLPEPGLMSVVNPNPQEYRNPLAFPVKLLLNRGTPLSDLWLPVRINGDMAVMRGIMKEMLAEEEKNPGSIFDREFIENFTIGFDEFVAHLRATNWDDILVSSGLTREQIRAAAEIAMKSKRIICCWAMGLTQHKNAVATIQEVMNFLLLGGHIGRPGAGPCPVRGHSNVQGDRTMGIWERMNDKFMDKLASEFGFEPPREHGTDTVETIKQMREGKIRFFLGLGGNFLSATPDTEFTAKAMTELPADRTCFHQAQSRASDHWRDRAHPAVPWSIGNRSADERRSICHGRRFDGRHQSVARTCRAGERSVTERSHNRLPAGARNARSSFDRQLGRAQRELRSHSRSHRTRHPGFREFQRTHSSRHLLFA